MAGTLFPAFLYSKEKRDHFPLFIIFLGIDAVDGLH